MSCKFITIYNIKGTIHAVPVDAILEIRSCTPEELERILADGHNPDKSYSYVFIDCVGHQMCITTDSTVKHLQAVINGLDKY